MKGEALEGIDKFCESLRSMAQAAPDDATVHITLATDLRDLPGELYRPDENHKVLVAHGFSATVVVEHQPDYGDRESMWLGLHG